MAEHKEITFADYALSIAELGRSVFPLKPNGKAPLTKNGFHDASIDPEQIKAWWKKSPNANIGIATGASGLFVLDVDVKNGVDGEATLTGILNGHNSLPSTLQVHTPTGGRHIYFKAPPDIKIPSTAGKLGAGLDTRGDGGYVVAPGSVVDGKPYTLVEDLLPAPMPDWLLKLLQRPNKKAAITNPQGINEGSRNAELTSMGGAMRRKNFSYEAIAAALQAHNRERCNPPLPPDEVERIALSVSRYDPDTNIVEGDAISTALLQKPTQENVALIFTHRYAGILLYSHRIGKWLRWDGLRWRYEDTGIAFYFAREVARNVNRNGKANAATAAFYNGVENIARKDPAFARRGDEFDRDNYLLNTPDGTYDLRTGIRYDNKPEDCITKITAVSPSADGGERFLRFLDEITGSDKALIKFLQVALGACLSGAIEAHWIMFWTGAGRNGKNTLGDLVMDILGDYSRKIPSNTLMDKSFESHPAEIAALDGVRLAISSEVNDGAHWHESRINELTGDAILSARFMRQDFFEFKRTHKHLIYGNHRPQMRSMTEAIKARIVIVPFKQSFSGREDPMLAAKLKAESGFVLNWLIEGHMAWVEGGRKLPVCAAVEAETAEYFSSQSTTEMWIAECCEILKHDVRGSKDLPTSTELYSSYRQWKINRGEQPISQTRWAEPMKRHFLKETKNNAPVRYRGVRLLF